MPYKTADTVIPHCIQYITNIPHSVLTGDVNVHSTLWHSYTDDHKGQLIADVIRKSVHITQTHQPECQTLQQTSSPRCLTHSTTGHRGQLNTHYHQTTHPSSPQLTYDMTTTKPRTFTRYKKAALTQFTEGVRFRSDHHTRQPYTLSTEYIQTSY